MANRTLTVQVTADIGTFKAGQELTTQAEIVSYVRTMATEAEVDLSDYTDGQLYALAETTPGEGEDWEVSVCEALETGNVPAEEGTEGEPAYEIADTTRQVAAKLADNKSILEWIDQIVAGQNKVDSGPAGIYLSMTEGPGALSPQEIALIPWPGSSATADDGTPTGINNPDVYPIRRQKANGEWTNTKGYVVRDLISLQPRVADLDKQLAEIVAPAGGKLTQSQVKARKRLNSDRSSAVRAYTRAIKVLLVGEKLRDHKFIGMELERHENDDGTPGKLVETKYCINLFNKMKNVDGGAVTVSAFIKLDYITPTTTYPALTASMVRSTKKPSTPTLPRLEAKDIPATMLNLSVALETNGIFAAVVSAVNQTDGERKEAADELLQTIGATEERLAAIMNMPGMRSRYAKLEDKSTASGNSKAQTKAA